MMPMFCNVHIFFISLSEHFLYVIASFLKNTTFYNCAAFFLSPLVSSCSFGSFVSVDLTLHLGSLIYSEAI